MSQALNRPNRRMRCGAALVCSVGAMLACAPIALSGPDCEILRTGVRLPGALDESSGVALGIRDPSVLWTHNDDGSILFAVDSAGALLGSLREKLEFYKAQVDAAKENQAQLDAKVEAVKATVRAQHEAGELHDDTMMDFDDGEDKARKSGRKSKHAMGARKL